MRKGIPCAGGAVGTSIPLREVPAPHFLVWDPSAARASSRERLMQPACSATKRLESPTAPETAIFLHGNEGLGAMRPASCEKVPTPSSLGNPPETFSQADLLPAGILTSVMALEQRQGRRP